MPAPDNSGSSCQRCVATGAGSWTNISIDRIDNSQGYELSNIRLVCLAVNTMRNAMSDEEMVAWAKLVSKYKPRQKSSSEQLTLFEDET